MWANRTANDNRKQAQFRLSILKNNESNGGQIV